MAKSKTLRELMIMKLKAIYDIEAELVKALPKMADAATDPELKEAFTHHLRETEAQVERLDQVFDLMGEKPEKEKVEAIRGMVADAEWIIKNTEEGDATDLALIAAGRRTEHYEKVGYAGVIEWAGLLDNDEAAELLSENMGEEEEADTKLEEIGTTIAERLKESEDED
jgi:ferritin-like metal-binding protein YciE